MGFALTLNLFQRDFVLFHLSLSGLSIAKVIYLKLVDHSIFSNLILLLFVSKLFNDARTSSFLLLDAER